MTIDFYGVNLSPPCRAVLIVAKYLKIDLNQKSLNLMDGEHLKPEFLKINPAHCIPTIVDNGFALWESRAINQYLCNKYAPDSDLYPKDPKDRANVDRMLNFDITLGSSIGKAMKRKGNVPTEADITAYKNNVKLLDTLIGDNGYVASNKLTLADISIFATFVLLHLSDFDFSEFSKVTQWFDRITNELSYFDQINGKAKEEYKTIMDNYFKNKAK